MDDSDVSLYDILSVAKDAKDAEIKESYLKLAEEFHPDKNPEAGEKFEKISHAYEVLSDPEKRKIYDRFGISQQSGNDFAGESPDSKSIFSRFFSSSGNKNIEMPLSVSLEDFYNGTEARAVIYKRWEICTECNGSGGDPSKEEGCPECEGFGCEDVYGITRRCEECDGRGKIIKHEFQCKTCEGRGIRENNNSVDVTIKKGMHHMEKIPFRAEGNQDREGDRGHLIIILQQEPHPVFQRKVDNLYMSQVKITLTQALCGLEYTFKHLDDRDLVVRTQPGQVIKPYTMMIVKGEGMPKHNRFLEKGDLLISFAVEMPEKDFASSEVMEKLEKILPPRVPFTMPVGEDVEEVQMEDVQPSIDNEATGEEPGVAQCAFS